MYRKYSRWDDATPEERFWAKVEKTETCWLWMAAKHHSGYGVFTFNGKMVQAHRYAYELLVGPIPGDLELDHLCRVRACVNVVHLEAVTRRENVLRGETIVAREAAQTHCAKGHVFNDSNTYHWPQRPASRACRECHRLTELARRRASRIAVPAMTT